MRKPQREKKNQSIHSLILPLCFLSFLCLIDKYDTVPFQVQYYSNLSKKFFKRLNAIDDGFHICEWVHVKFFG